MELRAYTCTADNRVVDKGKYLNLLGIYSGVMLKSNESIMNPTIILQVNDTAEMENLAKCNYLWLDSINTAYYVTDIKFLGGLRVQLNCKEDVLYTYKDDIYKLSAVVMRQENVYNRYLDDKIYKTYNYRRVQTKAFPNGFDKANPHYILITAGGGDNA